MCQDLVIGRTIFAVWCSIVSEPNIGCWSSITKRWTRWSTFHFRKNDVRVWSMNNLVNLCLFSGVQVRSPMLEFDWRSMFNTMVFDPSLVKTTNNFSLYNIWPDKTNLRFMAVGPSYTLTRLTCDMTSISINMSVWRRISSTPCLKNRQAQRAVQKDVQSYCPEKTRCCSITILMNTVGKTISWVLPFLQRVQRF